MSGKHPTDVTQVSERPMVNGDTQVTLSIQKETGTDVRTMTVSADGNRTVLTDSTMFTGDNQQQAAAVEHGRRASGGR